MTPAALRTLGTKLRTQVRGPILDYIDGTLPLLVARSEDPECAKCAERRKAKAESQKRWRKNRGAR